MKEESRRSANLHLRIGGAWMRIGTRPFGSDMLTDSLLPMGPQRWIFPLGRGVGSEVDPQDGRGAL